MTPEHDSVEYLHEEFRRLRGRLDDMEKEFTEHNVNAAKYIERIDRMFDDVEQLKTDREQMTSRIRELLKPFEHDAQRNKALRDSIAGALMVAGAIIWMTESGWLQELVKLFSASP